jgi:hypothetical protein
MEENPYKAPQQNGANKPSLFLRRPTVIEWVVIVLVVLVGAALFIPDLDSAAIPLPKIPASP